MSEDFEFNIGVDKQQLAKLIEEYPYRDLGFLVAAALDIGTKVLLRHASGEKLNDDYQLEYDRIFTKGDKQ